MILKKLGIIILAILLVLFITTNYTNAYQTSKYDNSVSDDPNDPTEVANTTNTTSTTNTANTTNTTNTVDPTNTTNTVDPTNTTNTVDPTNTVDQPDLPDIPQADDNKVSHRHMAIACAMAYVQPQPGQKLSSLWKMSNIITSIVNDINAGINLNEYAEVEELDDWIVGDQIGGITGGFFTEDGMAGFTLERTNKDGSKDVILLFRATDTEVLSDIIWGLTNEHNQEDNAIKFAKEVVNKYSDEAKRDNKEIRLYIAGHSLGGYLAQITGATLNQEFSKGTYDKNLVLKEVVGFNGIGINFLTYFGEKYNYGNKNEIIEELKKLNEENKLIEYYTYGDWVSALGVHYGEMRMLYPSIDSVTYQRDNFSILQKFGNKLITLLSEKNKYNMFKTAVKGAAEFYGAKNFGSYFLLTHETDTFVTLDLAQAKAKNVTPSIKVTQFKSALPGPLLNYYKEKDLQQKGLTTGSNFKLKALTSHVAVRKYVWERSLDNGATWETVKSIDIRDTKGETITNTLDVDITTIDEGKSVLYKVTAYYDDGFEVQKVTKNENGNYAYEKDEARQAIADKSKTEGRIEATVKVTRDDSVSSNGSSSNVKSFFEKVLTWIKTLINKVIEFFTRNK